MLYICPELGYIYANSHTSLFWGPEYMYSFSIKIQWVIFAVINYGQMKYIFALETSFLNWESIREKKSKLNTHS